jgi:hypothetical protein
MRSEGHYGVLTWLRTRAAPLYAQSDLESKLEAQGKFLAQLPGDKAHPLTGTIQ